MQKLPEARLVGWLLKASIRDQPWQWAVASLSIALGLALAVSIYLVNQSAVESMNRAVKTLAGEAQAQLLSRHDNREGFSDRVLDELLVHRDRLGLLDASPVVKGRIAQVDVLGIDLFRAASVSRSLLPSAEDAGLLDLLNENTIFLSQAALDGLEKDLQGRLIFESESGTIELQIAGRLNSAGQSALGVMDIAGAQSLFGRLNQLDRIDLSLRQGQSVQAFNEALQLLGLDRPLLKGVCCADAPESRKPAQQPFARLQGEPFGFGSGRCAYGGLSYSQCCTAFNPSSTATACLACRAWGSALGHSIDGSP